MSYFFSASLHFFTEADKAEVLAKCARFPPLCTWAGAAALRLWVWHLRAFGAAGLGLVVYIHFGPRVEKEMEATTSAQYEALGFKVLGILQ